MHNIYPKNYMLYKWGLSETPECSFCNENETLKHVLVECEISKESFMNYRKLLEITNQNCLLTEAEIIFGVKKQMAITHGILLIKGELLKQNNNCKTVLSLEKIETLLRNELRIEETINKHKALVKWHKFKYYLDQN